MIGVFKQKNPGNIFVLFLLSILLKIPVFFRHPQVVLSQSDGPLYRLLIKYTNVLASMFPGIYVFFTFGLLFLQALLLLRFINKNRLMARSNFLPGMAFIIISSFLPEFNVFSSVLLVSLIFLIVFITMFKTASNKIGKGDIFNAALFISMATLLFGPAIFFTIWLIFALALLRPFKVNEWLVLLLGLATPYYFGIIFMFLADAPISHLLPAIKLHLPQFDKSLWIAGALFLLLVPFFIGAYYAQLQLSKTLIHVRKAWELFLIYIVICIFISLFNMGDNYMNFVLVLIPIAAFHGYAYFNAEWKPFPKILFWLSILFIVSYQVAGW